MDNLNKNLEQDTPEEEKSELDIAREQFLRKRKWTYIETAVIIILAMLFYLFKTLVG